MNTVLDFFPADQQGQIRAMVSESLRGILSQQLIPRADGKGVALATEILIADAGVSAMIRNNQFHQLTSKIQTSKAKGMKLMDDALMELARNKEIHAKDAHALAENKPAFEQMLR